MNINSRSKFRLHIFYPIGLILVLFVFFQGKEPFFNIINSQSLNSAYGEIDPIDKKHKGAHVFGYLDTLSLKSYLHHNFDWITMVAYGSQDDIDSPTIRYYRGDSLEMLRRDSVWKQQIDLAHNQGLKVFLKPHIWLHDPADGKWRSDIFPSSELNWDLWKQNYTEYILYYADIAERNNVDMFCIGAEFSRLTLEKSEYWSSLIQEIRKIYSGKITYAANWYREYENVTFWDKLDFIGVQAYFPLTKNKEPSLSEISKGWDKYLPKLEAISKKYQKKSAIKPWEWIENSERHENQLCLETQANCYSAFFTKVWNKKWFGGVHIWQLRSDWSGSGGPESMDFTPQRKPAINVIAKGFEGK